MSALGQVILCGDLTPKWARLGQELTETGGTIVTRCTGEPAETLALCRRLSPCVLVADAAFIEHCNPEDFSTAVDFGQTIQVLIEADEPGLARAEHLIRLGCGGLLNRSSSPSLARRALRAVLDGELWASRKLLSGMTQKLLRESKHQLTFRESEILALVAEGLKNHEIAEHLFISPQTVRWHLRSLYCKLGTHDRKRAAFSGCADPGSVRHGIAEALRADAS
jgi:DNA-binding NarL/FixJ family response regulator